MCSFLLLMYLHTLINRKFLPCRTYQYHLFFFSFFFLPTAWADKVTCQKERDRNQFLLMILMLYSCMHFVFCVYMHHGFIAFVTCCINYNVLCECILLFVYTHERSPGFPFLFLVSGLAAVRWSYSLLYGNRSRPRNMGSPSHALTMTLI